MDVRLLVNSNPAAYPPAVLRFVTLRARRCRVALGRFGCRAGQRVRFKGENRIHNLVFFVKIKTQHSVQLYRTQLWLSFRKPEKKKPRGGVA